MNWLRINRIVTAVITLILIGSAALGFAGRSQSMAYDVFHLIFSLIGAMSVVVASGRAAPAFNLTFGLIDAYQAVAQLVGIFPTWLFNLTPSDRVQHIAIAVVLICVSTAWFMRADKKFSVPPS